MLPCEHRSPHGSTARGVEERLGAASQRRQQLFGSKQATLAKNNEHASEVAEAQKTRLLSEVTNQRAETTAKMAKAEQSRLEMLALVAESAGARVGHAKDKASEVAARREQEKAERRASSERKAEAAELHVAESKSATVEKAAAEVAKAKQLAEAKKESVEAQRKAAELKAAAADQRRRDLESAKLGKLEDLAQHAAHVRRKKGSTPARSTVAAESKAVQQSSPTAFDMDVRSDMPAKSPVQARLEARTAALAETDICHDAYDKAELEQSQIDAVARQEALVASKAAAAAEKNRKIEAVRAEAAAKAEAKAAEVAAKHEAKQAQAKERRSSLISQQVGKNAQHFAEAKKKGEEKKTEQKIQESERVDQLQEQQQQAACRRAEMQAEREAKRIGAIAKHMTACDESEQAKELELASKRAAMEQKLADANERRAMESARKAKKAEAFASPWSEQTAEIRSPGKSPEGKTARNLADVYEGSGTASGTSAAEAILQAAKAEPAVEPSPRKAVEQFLSSTPPKAAAPQEAQQETQMTNVLIPAAVLALLAIVVAMWQMM